MAAAMGIAGKQQQLWGGPVGDSSGSSSGEVPSCRSSGEMSAALRWRWVAAAARRLGSNREVLGASGNSR